MRPDRRVRLTMTERFPALPGLSGLAASSRLLQHLFGDFDEDLRRRCAEAGFRTIGDFQWKTEADLLEVRGLRPREVAKIVAFLGRVSREASSLGTSLPTSTQDATMTLAAWAHHRAGADTWGDVIDALRAAEPPADVDLAVKELIEQPLPPVHHLSASRTVEDWLGQRDPRDAEILDRRILGDPRLTLDELGQELGVTRERARQLEQALLSSLRDTLKKSDAWRVLRWVVDEVASSGSFFPRANLGNELVDRLAICLADLTAVDDALIHKDFRLPRLADIPRMANKQALIDEAALVEILRESGVQDQWMPFAIEHIPGIRRCEGELVIWPSSMVDRAIAVLTVNGSPMDPAELADAIGGEVSIRSLRQRLFGDPRVQRVSKDYVGLADWGGNAYTSVSELMISHIETHGPVALQDLCESLHQSFGTSSASVKMISAAPAFLVRNGRIELRTAEHPFVPRAEPHRVAGLYRLSDDRLLLSLIVDRELLRGSGRAIAQEVAQHVGVFPGEQVTLHSDLHDVPISWSVRSHTGPQIGSIKPLLEESGAQLGQRVHLVIDREYYTIEVRLQADPVPRETREHILRRLTGLDVDKCIGLTGIAEAIGSHRFDVVADLEKRGDSEVAAAVRLAETR